MSEREPAPSWREDPRPQPKSIWGFTSHDLTAVAVGGTFLLILLLVML